MTEPLRAAPRDRQALRRDACARASARGAGLPPRHGRRTSRAAAGDARRERSEHVHRIADGRWLRIRESRTPDGGRVLLTTDITEERRRAEQLRLLALAVEQAGDPVEITGADHGFTYVNRAFETTTGYSRGEALGREPQEVLSSGVQPPEFFAGDARASSSSGRTWHGTIVNRHRDGHLIEQETTISPMRDENGAITHYRRGEARRHRGARPGAGAGRERGALPRGGRHADRVHRPGRPRRLLDVHERGGRALHRHDARGDARAGAARPRPDPARGPPALRRAHGAHHPGDTRPSTVELRGRHPDGSVHWEHWTDTGIFDAEGKLLEIQCVGREITDRKLAEAAREEAERLRLRGAGGGARLLHRHRRPAGVDRRVQRRRRAHLRLRPRRRDRPADGRADRAAAPARGAPARLGAATSPAAARHRSAAGSRSTRCAPTARSSRSRSSS